jgi:glycosidase
MHPLLYEINTRCWLRELSGERGATVTLANVPGSEFDHWQRLGFTHIWLMGVWTTGPRSREFSRHQPDVRRDAADLLPDWCDEDIAGSPYAIADYTVAPALGGEKGLRSFRQKLSGRGLKLILDFIPNHTGLDHPWLANSPERFVPGGENAPGSFLQQTRAGPRWIAHGRDPYFPAWADTAQLDYRNPDTRAAMIAELKAVATQCDGVRCDMAMLVLNDVIAKTWADAPMPDSLAAPRSSSSPREERVGRGPRRGEITQDMPPLLHPMGEREKSTASEFWTEAIASVKSVQPDFLFLAEAYWDLEPRLQSLGFDYTYDKRLYDRLIERQAQETQRHLLDAPPDFVRRCAHFLENHDEPRIASCLTFEEHRAAALLMLGLPGMRFLHDGQLTGAVRKLSVHLGRRPRTLPDPKIVGLYESLLTGLPSTAVGRGRAELIPPTAAWPDNPSAQNFVLVQWQATPPQFDLVAVNLAPHRGQC